MIRLDSTTRKLQIILGGAITTNQLSVTVGYQDNASAPPHGMTRIGGSQVSNTNSGTAVDICNAPTQAGICREIDWISVYNLDTVSAVVTLRYNDNGTTYNIVKVTLLTGEHLQYSQDDEFRCLDASGNVKFVVSGLAITNIAGLGTGVATALGVNVGSAGAFVTFNGALGTPSSGTATNLTGTASGLTAGTASALAATAWSAYTPSISSTTGTLTSASAEGRWTTTQGGKIICFRASGTITTNGTGATAIDLTLPTNAQAANVTAFVGREMNVTGKLLIGYVNSVGNVRIQNYDGTYPAADGYKLIVSGCYEGA